VVFLGKLPSLLIQIGGQTTSKTTSKTTLKIYFKNYFKNYLKNYFKNVCGFSWKTSHSADSDRRPNYFIQLKLYLPFNI